MLKPIAATSIRNRIEFKLTLPVNAKFVEKCFRLFDIKKVPKHFRRIIFVDRAKVWCNTRECDTCQVSAVMKLEEAAEQHERQVVERVKGRAALIYFSVEVFQFSSLRPLLLWTFIVARTRNLRRW